MNCLPLKHDKEEAKEQHELLCNLIVADSAQVFGDQYQNMLQILGIFSETVETKLINEETVQKIKVILQQLESN